MSLFGMAWSLASTLAKLKGYDIQLIWEWFLSENEPLLTLFRKPQGAHGIQDASHSLKSSVHDREFFSLTRRRSLVRS